MLQITLKVFSEPAVFLENQACWLKTFLGIVDSAEPIEEEDV